MTYIYIYKRYDSNNFLVVIGLAKQLKLEKFVLEIGKY